MRKIGELSAALPTAPGARTDLEPSDTADVRLKTDTLENAGISIRTAQRAERIAAIPERKFEAYIAAKKDEGKAVTVQTGQNTLWNLC